MPPKRKKATKSKGEKKKKIQIKIKVKKEVKEETSQDEDICNVCNKPRKGKRRGRKSSKNCYCKTLVDLTINQPMIKCKQCPKIYKLKSNYLMHLKNEHSKTPGSVSCDDCHVSCPNKAILAKHIEDIHRREEFECPQCKKTFVRHAHVLRHMAQSGCDGTEVTMFPCEICDATFTRKDNLIVHLRLQHILKAYFACKICNIYSTKNFSKLVKHWQEKHVPGTHKYECDICGKSTSSRTSIAKHLEIHGDKKFACPTCGYRTFTAEVLKRHVLTHVADKPHKCAICGASYIQRSQLQRHLEKHAGNQCATCGQNFVSKSRLIVHQRSHLGLKRLFCPYEDCLPKKEFTSENSLAAHVTLHLNAKKYSCEVCNKSFHSEMNMRRHTATHKLDRPRRCMYCVTARAYIRGEQLVRHVRKHHPELFCAHLAHVRQVLGTSVAIDRVKKSELESVLNMLDAESERILDGYGGSDVLYGGVQEQDAHKEEVKTEDSPIMTEKELEENLRQLLSQLIDKDTLEHLGWPDESVDVVLENVVLHAGVKAADSRFGRVQRLRENTKQLFLYAVEDAAVARMLHTHTIDQVVRHILAQVAEPE